MTRRTEIPNPASPQFAQAVREVLEDVTGRRPGPKLDFLSHDADQADIIKTLNNIIQRLSGNNQPETSGDYAGDELQFVPTITASSGALGSHSASMQYRVSNHILTFSALIKIVDGGTASGFIKMTLPVAAAGYVQCVGRDDNNSVLLRCGGNKGSTQLYIITTTTDWSDVYKDGVTLNLAGSYMV